MTTAKLIFYAIVILLAAVGAFMLFGFVVAAIQYLVILGALLLVGLFVVKLLKRPDDRQLEANPGDRELKEAVRELEAIKRRQITK
jgi:hypothetical protein